MEKLSRVQIREFVSGIVSKNDLPPLLKSRAYVHPPSVSPNPDESSLELRKDEYNGVFVFPRHASNPPNSYCTLVDWLPEMHRPKSRTRAPGERRNAKSRLKLLLSLQLIVTRLIPLRTSPLFRTPPVELKMTIDL